VKAPSLPSLTRERRNGRPVGPWLAELDGEIVDLHTKVKATAIGRAAKLAGKKNGKNGAAALTSQAFAVAESAPPAADSPTVAAGGAPAGGVIENSATPDPGPRLLEAIHPDAVFPPPPPETGDWTADAASTTV